MEKYKFIRLQTAEKFFCDRCQKDKVSKNKAICGEKTICNGCFGYLLSKKEIEKEENERS